MTSTPPWGTPMRHPEPPPPPSPERERFTPVVDGGDRFVVLVEQTTGSGENKRWDLVWPPFGPGSRAQAREHARRTAYEFVPANPYTEQRRSVFRLDDDSFLVQVEGMMTSFHFRVSVARALPDRP